jgi:hypothetical protein
MMSSAMIAGTVNFGIQDSALRTPHSALHNHRVVLLGMPAPVSKDALARTVEVSPMPEEMRVELMGHRGAVRLLYVGESDAPVEQLTALHSVAGALMAMGGMGLLNERAALALPATLARQYLSQLGEGTLPIELWVGAVTFRIDEAGYEAEQSRYLMRTYGMEQMRLPDLGMIMREQSQADDAYRVLMNVCLYMAESATGEPLTGGDRVDFGGRTYLLTDPGEDVGQFAPAGRVLLVIEV